jgi:hypothetical protein
MTTPGQPFDVPDDALNALADFRANFESLLPAEAAFAVGFKKVGGEYLDGLALIVYVPDKLALESVPQGAVIPPTWSFGGIEFPTDVVQSVAVDIALVNDSGSYSPANGGIEIGWNEIIDPVTGRTHRGTLGCIVARRGTGELLALTARHVAPENTTANQPAPDALHTRVLGTVGSGDTNSTWDSALVTLAGTEPSPIATIQEIGAVAGQATFQLWGAANKRGRTTGLTNGLVVSYIPDPAATGIERFVVDTFPFGGLYCQHGDSGSAVVNGNNEVIGLLVQMGADTYSDTGEPLTSLGYVVPVQRVVDGLNVDIST